MSPVWLPAELADGGINRRRSSGRVRGGKDDDNKNHHGATSLYTVVTMDPDDEVMSWPLLCHCFGSEGLCYNMAASTMGWEEG